MTEPRQPPVRGTTSGSDTRDARRVAAPVHALDVAAEAERLMAEPEWTDGDRNSRTLMATDRMRVVLTALRSGASLGNEATSDSLAIQVLQGRVGLAGDRAPVTLTSGQLVTLERPHDWRLAAETDSLLLITTALSN